MSGQLTPEQSAVVDHEHGHAIVGAVAGSGKTHTMVARVIRRLKQGVDPCRILVLMFNRSAKKEFVRRLARECAAHGLTPAEVQTFHSFGLRLCKRLESTGHLRSARLETDNYLLRQLAKQVLAEVNENSFDDDKLDLTYEVQNRFLEAVDLLKGDMYPGDKERTASIGVDKRFLYGFNTFEEIRQEKGLRFLSDLIYDPVMKAVEDPQLAALIGNRYDEIIVDEFQDVNELQVVMLRIIAGTRASVMAVGDDDQCIYSWRGARPDYMTHLFHAVFPGATRYTLPHTFRYGHALSMMANFVITKNKNRTDKLCISGTDRETTLDVRLPKGSNGSEVATVLKEWVATGRSLKEAVVLFREYSHTPSTEIALLRSGIPYVISGASPFFDRADVLGLRAYLQLASGSFDAISDSDRRFALFNALLQTPTLYLRRPVLDAISEQASASPEHFLQIAEHHFNSDTKAQSFTKNRRFEALSRWRWVMSHGAKMKAGDLLTAIIDKTNLYKEIDRNTPDLRDANEKKHMITQLMTLATSQNYSPGEFCAFLDELAIHYTNSSAENDRVELTSCHRAKGLEWPLVILPELSDSAFPSLRDGHTEADVESERRLFYVASTRAIERLVMLAPHDPAFIRAAHSGKSDASDKCTASRFLYEANILVASETAAGPRRIAPDPRCSALVARYSRMQGH